MQLRFTKNKPKFLTIMVIELIIIILLVFYVIDKQKNPAQTIYSSVILHKNILFTEESDLKNYYEPNPGQFDGYTPPWISYDLIVSINSDTLNERFEYSTSTPENTFRLITLGDSWVFGMFVSTEDNFSEQLEDLLNNNLSCPEIEKFEVINLGVPNYEITYSVERFRLRGVKYNPNMVIWLINPDDIEDINDFIEPRKEHHRKLLEQSGKEYVYDEYEGIEKTFVNPPDAIAALSNKRAREDLLQEFGIEKIMDYQKERLYRLRDYYPGELIIYTLSRIMSINKNKAQWNEILDIFQRRSNNVSIYNSKLSFDIKEDQLIDFHPNQRGHQLIAKDLYNYLIQNTLSSCTTRDLLTNTNEADGL